jgi:hypothetical protein
VPVFVKKGGIIVRVEASTAFALALAMERILDTV